MYHVSASGRVSEAARGALESVEGVTRLIGNHHHTSLALCIAETWTPKRCSLCYRAFYILKNSKRPSCSTRSSALKATSKLPHDLCLKSPQRNGERCRKRSA